MARKVESIKLATDNHALMKSKEATWYDYSTDKVTKCKKVKLIMRLKGKDFDKKYTVKF